MSKSLNRKESNPDPGFPKRLRDDSKAQGDKGLAHSHEQSSEIRRGGTYSFIVNPKSGRRVSIYGKTGIKILKNYINILGQAGGTPRWPWKKYLRTSKKDHVNECMKQFPQGKDAIEKFANKLLQEKEEGKRVKILEGINLPEWFFTEANTLKQEAMEFETKAKNAYDHSHDLHWNKTKNDKFIDASFNETVKKFQHEAVSKDDKVLFGDMDYNGIADFVVKSLFRAIIVAPKIYVGIIKLTKYRYEGFKKICEFESTIGRGRLW